MKNLYIIVITIVIILFSLFSCSSNNNTTNNPTNTIRRRQTIKQTVSKNTQNETVNNNENFYVYESRGRRDPFQPVLKIESKIDISKVKLVGFFEDMKKKVVKAILEDASGNSYYVSEGDFLGNAKVVSIDQKKKQVICEIQKEYYTEKKVLTLEE